MENKKIFFAKRQFFKQMCVFTLLFAIASVFCFIQFALQHKEFMIEYDSIAEYLTVLIYWGKYLREFLNNLFINHSFILPQWDFSIGLGADILTTLHWYIIGEPLNLLAVFFKPESTHHLYNFLLFFRLYLSGIAFVLFCNYKKYDAFYSVLGAISYIFCGWIFYVGIRHIYFVTPMIYLPLMFLGVEKIFDGKKPFLFIVSTALACISNFYFFYILTLLCFFYAIIRFFAVFKTNIIRNLGIYAGKTILFYIIGVCMAAIVFLPNVASFLLTSRSNIKIPVPLFYDLKYYPLMFLSLVSPKMFFSYTVMGFSAIVLPALCVAISNKSNENRSYLAIFLLFIIFLIFPIFGHVFNGFNYLTNRWCFAISFITAILITTNTNNLFNLQKKNMLICFGFPALLGIGVLLLSAISSKFREVFCVSYATLLFVVLGLGFLTLRNFSEKAKKIVLSVLMVISVSANANLRFSKNGYNFLHNFIEKGSPNSLIFDTIDANIDTILNGDTDFFRYEQSNRTLLNNAILFGTKSTQFYWSENSDEIMSFLRELAVTNSGNQKLTSLGNRSYLLSLLNTKYIFLSENEPVPFGFEEYTRFTDRNNDYIVYKNKNALPFSFTFSNFIGEKTFLSLNFAQRSETLLNYAIVKENEKQFIQNNLLENNPTINDSVQNNFSVNFGDDIKQSGNDFDVKKADAKINIKFTSVPNAENFLSFKGISYNKNNDDCHIKIFVNGDYVRSVELNPKYWRWEHNHLIQLYGLNEGENSLEIEFETKGNYTIEELMIVSQKTANLKKYIEKLSNNKLENVILSPNKISGKIKLSEPKILCFSMPYSKGWKAKANGTDTKLLNIQLMYSGIFLEPGEYNIELEYQTPFLRFGAFLSLAGLCIFVIMIIVDKKKSRIQGR